MNVIDLKKIEDFIDLFFGYKILDQFFYSNKIEIDYVNSLNMLIELFKL